MQRRTLQLHCPIEHYDTVKKQKEAVFPYLIPSDQPDQPLLNWVDKCNQKYPHLINHPDGTERIVMREQQTLKIYPTRLPPLSTALLCGRVAVAKALANSPHIDFNAVDGRGWTPVQHAIACRTDLIDRVCEAARGKFPFLRDVASGRVASNDQRVVSYLQSDGTVVPLSQKAFRKLVGGTPFSPHPIASPEALFQNWYLQKGGEDLDYTWLQSRFDRYKQFPPTLYLSMYPGTGVGVGVTAAQPIHASQFVGFFGSVVTQPINGVKWPDLSFSWGDLLNDGFPNLLVAEGKIDGVMVRGLLALREIRPGEQLFLNLDASHSDKWVARVEFALDETLKHFPDFRTVLKTWHSIEKTKGQEQTFDALFQKGQRTNPFLYLFHTPSLLLSLIAQRHFDLDSVEKFLDQPDVIQFLGFHQGRGEVVLQFYKNVFECLKRISRIADLPEVREHLSRAFLTNVRTAFHAASMTMDRWKSYGTVDDWKNDFRRISNGAEGFYFLQESQESKKRGKALLNLLSPEEQAEVIRLTEKKIGFIFRDIKTF